MDKIVFYSNDWEETKEFIEYYNKLMEFGWEVAFSTDNKGLVPMIAVGRMLLVTLDSYYPDVIVSNQRLKGYDVISSKDFLEAFNELS